MVKRVFDMIEKPLGEDLDQKQQDVKKSESVIINRRFNSSLPLKSAKKRRRLYNEAVRIHAPIIWSTMIKKLVKKPSAVKRQFNYQTQIYECQREGGKNITKNIGMQLRRFFMLYSFHPVVAQNKTIQTFINPSTSKQLNYSLSSFRQLKDDKLAN